MKKSILQQFKFEEEFAFRSLSHSNVDPGSLQSEVLMRWNAPKSNGGLLNITNRNGGTMNIPSSYENPRFIGSINSKNFLSKPEPGWSYGTLMTKRGLIFRLDTINNEQFVESILDIKFAILSLGAATLYKEDSSMAKVSTPMSNNQLQAFGSEMAKRI